MTTTTKDDYKTILTVIGVAATVAAWGWNANEKITLKTSANAKEINTVRSDLRRHEAVESTQYEFTKSQLEEIKKTQREILHLVRKTRRR